MKLFIEVDKLYLLNYYVYLLSFNIY